MRVIQYYATMLYVNKTSYLAIYFTKLRNSSLRKFFWPIRSNELLKFLPMAGLMFMILLNQNIIRTMKDSLVATMIGPEVINFIKFWFEMPIGIIFVLIYTKMCNVMTTEKAFRIVMITLLAIFCLFVYVLFPYQNYFHPNPLTVEYYIQSYPHLKWFIVIWGKWSFVLFYILGELWPVIVFALLFWQLANKITKSEEAGRFYSFFTLFGQSNLLISGSLLVYFSSGKHFLVDFFDTSTDKTEVLFKSFAVIVLLSGCIALLLHLFVELRIMKDPKYFTPRDTVANTLKLSLKDSIRMILSSKYLGLVCLLIISYSISINLIEGIWMSKVQQLNKDINSYMAYQGQVYFFTGIVTFTCAIIGNTIINKFGWYGAAILTPLSALITGFLFFISIIADTKFHILFDQVHTSSLAIAVYMGAIQFIIIKGTKYTLFDTTKEMAYIPLSDEMKTKGKAAVDIVGVKIGKSTGAIVQIMTFILYPTACYNDIAHLLMIMYITICFIWIFSVRTLSKYYKEMLQTPQ